jgi:hypothetical protein
MLTVLSAFALLPALPVSHAQTAGTVCVADVSSTSCPPAPASFTGPLGQNQFAINIQNSDRFNAFDVSVKTDPFVLEPASIDLTGSLIHDPRQIVRECINNNPVVGSCISGIDDYGIVSLAVTALGYDIEAPASGRLFSITYNTGPFFSESGDSTPITFQTGCTNTSNNGFCVTIADGTGTAVPENLQEATFTFRDFSVRISPTNFLIISKGEDPTFTLTVTSIGDFAGTITLSTSVDPTRTHPPRPSVNPTSVTLSPGSTSTSTLTVTTTRSTTVGRYVISAIGTDGVLTRFESLTLFIENR